MLRHTQGRSRVVVQDLTPVKGAVGEMIRSTFAIEADTPILFVGWLGARQAFFAPSLVGHYVTRHSYLPPMAFIQAVLTTDRPVRVAHSGSISSDQPSRCPR